MQKPNTSGAYQGGAFGQGDGPSDPFQRAIHEIFNSAPKDFSPVEVSMYHCKGYKWALTLLNGAH